MRGWGHAAPQTHTHTQAGTTRRDTAEGSGGGFTLSSSSTKSNLSLVRSSWTKAALTGRIGGAKVGRGQAHTRTPTESLVKERQTPQNMPHDLISNDQECYFFQNPTFY